MEEKKYYNLQGILDWLGFPHKFEDKKPYPFNRSRDEVTFSWGQILIPKTGIHEIVQNKISDIKDMPIKEIKMMYQIPFKVDNKRGTDIGVINQNISLTFRYDKTYKYGEVNKSIYEVCFFILENSTHTNDFYIITDDTLFTFFSYYIIDNQWGVGSLTVSFPCAERYFVPLNAFNPEECINCKYLDDGDKCTLKTECVNGDKFVW